MNSVRKQFLLLFVIPAGLFVLRNDASALGYRGEDGSFGLKIGLVGSGEVEINNRSLDQNTAVSLGAFYDASISSHFFWGLSVDFHRMDWQRPTTRESDKRTMIDIAAGLKYRISAADGLFSVRPGFSIGTGILRSISGLNNARFLTIKATAELLFYFSEDLGLIVEGGVFAAPSGNDNINEVSVRSLPIIRAGLVF